MIDYSEMSNEEMNIAIAEKIMDWHSGDYNEEDAWFNGAGEFMEYISGFEPTSDLYAAFQIVEVVRALLTETHKSAFWQLNNSSDGETWRAELFRGHYQDDVKMFQVSAATLPRAICIAALQSVEEKA